MYRWGNRLLVPAGIIYGLFILAALYTWSLIPLAAVLVLTPLLLPINGVGLFMRIKGDRK
jgi:hypothetical protein